MKDITKLEMEILLTIVKSPEIEYNANNISKSIEITPMGALKILKRLENENVIKSKKVGKAVIYRINTQNNYAISYISLVLSRETIYTSPKVRRWIQELKKIKNADIMILYGSLLKNIEPNDIDVLFVTNKDKFKKLQREIEEINRINIKKIHPLYQTFEDITDNIKKRHKPLLDAIKGIIVYGQEKFIGVYNESRKE